MPRELVATAPRTPAIREYDEQPLSPNQIRIRTEFASPKHGTELVAYRNDPVANRPYDYSVGAVLPRDPTEGLNTFPRPLGNMAVGVVSETGTAVSGFASVIVSLDISQSAKSRRSMSPRPISCRMGSRTKRPCALIQLSWPWRSATPKSSLAISSRCSGSEPLG